jgi:hypothetical protein
MHDDAIDERTSAFLEEVRLEFRATAPPAPGPLLTSFFALANDKSDLPVTAASNATRSAPQTAGLPNWMRRRIDVMNSFIGQVSTRVAAGALGALLVVGGLGAAAIGPVGLASHEDDDHECVALHELADTFEENIVVCEVEGDDGASADATDTSHAAETADTVAITEEDDDEGADGEEGDLPPVPTSTSEAAQIHEFDEACGNHGMYVSFFAQMGFEPPCALAARAGEDVPDMSRQERKKLALEQRKACKAKAKAGTPCTPEDFTSGAAPEEEVADTFTDDTVADDAGSDEITNAGNGKGHKNDEGRGKGKGKGNGTKKGGKGKK